MATLPIIENRPVELVQRRHLFHKMETLILGDGAIRVERDGQTVTSIPYEQVTSVHLAFQGANHCGEAIPAYACWIRSGYGDKLKLQNIRFERPGEMSAHDAPYTEFVRALHEKLLPWRDRIRFLAGSNLYYWMGWMGLAFALLLLLMLPVLFFVDGGGTILLRKAWVFFMIPTLVAGSFLPLILRGRSAPYDPEEIPKEHLPMPPQDEAGERVLDA